MIRRKLLSCSRQTHINRLACHVGFADSSSDTLEAPHRTSADTWSQLLLTQHAPALFLQATSSSSSSKSYGQQEAHRIVNRPSSAISSGQSLKQSSHLHQPQPRCKHSFHCQLAAHTSAAFGALGSSSRSISISSSNSSAREETVAAGGSGGDGGGAPVEIFDRRLKAQQRDRAAAAAARAAASTSSSIASPLSASSSAPPSSSSSASGSPAGDLLVEQVASVLLDRIGDCTRTFPSVLLLGGASLPTVLSMLLASHGGIQRVVVSDISAVSLANARNSLPPGFTCANEDEVFQSQAGGKSEGSGGSSSESSSSSSNIHGAFVSSSSSSSSSQSAGGVEVAFVLVDEEHMPFRESSFDLVVSCLGLHWVNDLPGALTQMRHALTPDGLFLAAMLGGDTLRQLRVACTLAQMERQGGVAARVAPMAQVRDAGNLLTRAGFSLPTVDVDEFTVAYPSAIQVVEHLRSLGETDCTRHHGEPLPRDTALATAAIYSHMFALPRQQDAPPRQRDPQLPDCTAAEEREHEMAVTSTFQVIFMAGWSPHSSHQKAARRGSATVSMHDLQNLPPAQSTDQ